MIQLDDDRPRGKYSSQWEMNHDTKSLSGIEVRSKDGKLVNFIVIKHNEVLENNTPHRIVIKLNEKSEPIFPPPQTYEEIIKAKRRQQMLLYGSGTTSTTPILSNRSIAARRVAAARQAANLNRPMTAMRRRVASSRSSRNMSRGRSRRRPKPIPKQVEQAIPEVQEERIKRTIVEPEPPEPEPCLEPVAPASTSGQVLASMKDLSKQANNPLFKSVDPKEVKLLLKSAPPGASIVLPNGAVIKKSRRGGARVGAGRKRSRPLPVHNININNNNNNATHE